MRARGWKLAVQILSAALIASAVGTTSALGQVSMTLSGPPGFGPGGGNDIQRESFERIGRLLKLDEAQRDAAKTLFDEYRKQIEEIQSEQREAMKPVIESMQDGEHGDAMKKIGEISRKADARRKAATEQFTSDLKSVLTDAQSQAWPSVERMRRRDRELPGGSVSGASVDLIAVMDRIGLSEADRVKVADVLSEYENEMDARLNDRAKALAKTEDPMKSVESGQVMTLDIESMMERAKIDREDSLKTRQLNQRFAKRLAEALPEAKKSAFEAEVRAQSYRRIYRESEAARILKNAQNLKDLTPEQAQTLKELAAKYTREADAANAKWAAELEKAEADGRASSGGFMIRMGDSQTPELDAAKKARRDLDRSFADQAQNLLTPAQRDQLPKRAKPQISTKGGPGPAIDPEDLDMDVPDGAAVMIRHEVSTTPR